MQTEQAVLIAPERECQPISKEKWQALQNEVRQFKAYEKTIMGKMFGDKSQQFYLLSVRFIEQWKLYAGFHLPESHYPELMTTKPPDPYNEDLLQPIDPTKYIVSDDKYSDYYFMLKKDVVQNVHYRVVNEPVMRIFKNYPGVSLPRRYTTTTKGALVLETKFERVNFFVVSRSIARKTINGRLKLQTATAETSLYADIPVLRKEISSYWLPKFCKHVLKEDLSNLADTRNFKLWAYDRASDFPEIQQLFMQQDFPTAMKNSSLTRPRQLPNDRRSKFCDCFLSEGGLLMIELSENGSFLLDYNHTKNEDKCDFCRYPRQITFPCECKEAQYCSKLCLERDAKGDHKYKCRRFQQKNFKFDFRYESMTGRAGLVNLGNTCYMNASVQCLSNTVFLTEFFANGNVAGMINRDNPLGSKGAIVNSFLHTINNLWCGTSPTFRAEYLKMIIGQTYQMFAGTSQHDAQQFLLVLLDALHEDFNRARLRQQPPLPAIQGSDEEQSNASWQHYLSRNESLIVDLFAGQYKSKLRCSHCKHESTTFETFFTLTLPITIKDQVIFFFLGFNRPEFYSKVQLEIEEPTLDKIATMFARMLGRDYNPKRLKFFLLDNTIADISNSNYDRITEVVGKGKENMYCIELSEEELQLYSPEADHINRLNVYFKRSAGQKSNISRTPISRPFWFKFSELTVRDVQERIWRWMFSSTITRKDNEDVSINFARNFVKADQAPLRFYLKIKDEDGKVVYYKQRALLAQKDKFRNIQANFSAKHKFELECDVDYLIAPVCDEKQFGYYKEFRAKIAVEDEHQSTSLMKCFEKFRKPQTLENSNQWKCPTCNTERDAEKVMSLYKTSKYLIIHLKRFKQKSDFRKVKIDCMVQFPMKLDLKDHVVNLKCPMDSFEVLKNAHPKLDRERASYSLYAVINHHGALGGGHYTAYCLNNGAWFLYDDDKCREVGPQQVCTKDAYVLFYSRD